MRRLRGAALLVVVDLLEIRVDDLVVGTAACGAARGLAAGGRTATAFASAGLLRLLRFIERLADLHRGLAQCFGLPLDLLVVIAAEGVLQRLDRLLHGILVTFGNLVAGFAQSPLGRMDQRIGTVFRLDQLALALVFLGMRFGILDHAVDIRLRQATRRLDADLLLLAGRLVLGRNLDNAVGVDVESHLDLRHAARRRWNADQVELAEQLVVGRHLPFALEDPDRDRRLIVLGRREGLALLGRYRRVAIDQPGEHPAQGLDTERQRGNVEEEDILDLALQDPRLDRRADGHNLVRVDAAVWLLAEELLDRLDNLGHARHAADQDYLVDFGGSEAGFLEAVAAWPDGALDQIIDQRFELRARQLDVEMLGPVLIRGDERQVDVGLHR